MYKIRFFGTWLVKFTATFFLVASAYAWQPTLPVPFEFSTKTWDQVSATCSVHLGREALELVADKNVDENLKIETVTNYALAREFWLSIRAVPPEERFLSNRELLKQPHAKVQQQVKFCADRGMALFSRLPEPRQNALTAQAQQYIKELIWR